MSFLKSIFGGNRKRAEQLRMQALSLMKDEERVEENLDQAIELLIEAVSLNKRHAGQYLSLAAAYNMRCKSESAKREPKAPVISIDAAGGLLALSMFLDFNKDYKLMEDYERLRSELKHFVDMYPL